jgi:hypothetical protein
MRCCVSGSLMKEFIGITLSVETALSPSPPRAPEPAMSRPQVCSIIRDGRQFARRACAKTRKTMYDSVRRVNAKVPPGKPGGNSGSSGLGRSLLGARLADDDFGPAERQEFGLHVEALAALPTCPPNRSDAARCPSCLAAT